MYSACLSCENRVKNKVARYCSNKCQNDFEYDKYIKNWKRGKVNGSRGIYTKNISGYLIRYLRNKYSECTICSWNKVNPITLRVPLEIDHIDGDSDNNTESNLRLICPNCHSLTINFRNLNKGSGRSWRRLKYTKSA